MPNGYSNNPFDTIPTDRQSLPGPLRAASDWINSVTAPADSTAFGRLRDAGLDTSGSTTPWSQTAGWQQRLVGGARENQGLASSPYDAAYANQARASQMALMEQMRRQAAGPSLASLQGSQALANSGQQALAAAAMGGPGRASMLQAQQVGGGLAGDVAQGRLGEVMRSQAAMGGLAGGMRGADQQSALQDAAAQLAAQRNRDAMYRFYAGLGANASLDDVNYQLDRQKLAQRVLRGAEGETNQGFADIANTIASVAGMAAGGKGK